MVGVDAAGFAKPVFGSVGIELIQCQVFSVLQNCDARKRGGDSDCAASAAERTIAAVRSRNAISECDVQHHLTAMATPGYLRCQIICGAKSFAAPNHLRRTTDGMRLLPI